MSAFTRYLEGKIVDHFLRGVAVPPPAAVYLGLLESNQFATDGTVETGYSGYARRLLPWSATDSSGESSNTAGILFPANANPSSSVVITHIGVFDAETGGNKLIQFPMVEPKTVAPLSALWFSPAAISLFSPFWSPPNSAFVTSRSRGAGWETYFGGALVAPLSQTIEVATRSSIKSLNIITEGGPGSCVLDLRRSVKPALPGALDSVCGTAKPTITNGTGLLLQTFTGWTRTTFEAGDLIAFYLESSSAFTKLDVQIILEDVP